jgi:hypothetical protein
MIAGITVAFQIVQQSYTDTNDRLAVATRPNGIVIVSRSMNGFRSDAVHVGAAVLIILPYGERGAEFQNIMIGWDGRQGGSGCRCAR